MIKYSELEKGDKLKIIDKNLFEFAKTSNIVTVVSVELDSVSVENKERLIARFTGAIGAAQLEENIADIICLLSDKEVQACSEEEGYLCGEENCSKETE